MALKDWELIIKRRELTEYKNKNKTERITINTLNKKWYVFTGNRPNLFESKFNTKPHALKFAKAYMRKH